ncbi:hypothetical protein BDP27DRAFT_1427492 [Rhodocollybia butyracea]|uniref:Uncharacterized protein n=1 Tax=Rhodocollybia butyracea TaxID=206335 RepID=A0A9P5PG75_9AGAR|nr:hypothetical protein BDP27DRAFT_1427492 [Rhodocollybia butyracea]
MPLHTLIAFTPTAAPDPAKDLRLEAQRRGEGYTVSGPFSTTYYFFKVALDGLLLLLLVIPVGRKNANVKSLKDDPILAEVANTTKLALARFTDSFPGVQLQLFQAKTFQTKMAL